MQLEIYVNFCIVKVIYLIPRKKGYTLDCVSTRSQCVHAKIFVSRKDTLKILNTWLCVNYIHFSSITISLILSRYVYLAYLTIFLVLHVMYLIDDNSSMKALASPVFEWMIEHAPHIYIMTISWQFIYFPLSLWPRMEVNALMKRGEMANMTHKCAMNVLKLAGLCELLWLYQQDISLWAWVFLSPDASIDILPSMMRRKISRSQPPPAAVTPIERARPWTRATRHLPQRYSTTFNDEREWCCILDKVQLLSMVIGKNKC
jgi:hypothetical protein